MYLRTSYFYIRTRLLVGIIKYLNLLMHIYMYILFIHIYTVFSAKKQHNFLSLLFNLVFDKLLCVYSVVIFTVVKCRSEAFCKFHWRLPDSSIFCVHAG